MKRLTNIFLVFSIILFFTLTSCINDNEVIADESSNTTIVEAETLDTNNNVSEEIIAKKPVIEETKKEIPLIKPPVKEIKKEELSTVKKETKKVEKKELIKLSESIDLDTDRNQSYNPDNANAPIKIEKDDNLKLKPIFSDADLSKYYVVFKESHAKINRKDVSKLIKTNQIVYIANYQGIYKYCVGQSKTENEAKAFKAKFDAEQGKTSSIVATFLSAW